MELGGCHIPTFTARKVILFFHGEEPRGETGLSLLHLVAVSIPVKQVGAGGHHGGGQGGVAGSGLGHF